MDTLLHSPKSWFDVTPTGRISTRITKDQNDIDGKLFSNVQTSLQQLFTVLASIILVSIATPPYLVLAVIMGLLYYKVVKMYMNTQREIKRLEANSRTPLTAHIQETIAGISVIRAFGKS